MISESTNFETHKKPSCIDLIFTDQPNIVMESGTRASLDVKCHHQLNPPPPRDRKVWHYDRANVRLLRRSIDNFNWEGLFNQNPDPDWQVHSLPKPYSIYFLILFQMKLLQ